MKDREYLTEDRIREALKLEVSVAQDINQKILRRAEKSRGKHSLPGRAAIAAACMALALAGGIGVKASLTGRQVVPVQGREENESYLSRPDAQVTETEAEDGAIHREITLRTGDNAFVSIRNLSVDETCCSMLMVFEKDGQTFFMEPSASVSAALGETTEDLYYSIRKDFLATFQAYDQPYRSPDGKIVTPVDLKEEITQGLRAFAKEARNQAVCDALLAVADDYEQGRILYIDRIVKQNPGGGLKEWSWVCEDITDLVAAQEEGFILIADSVYGPPETYVIQIPAHFADPSCLYPGVREGLTWFCSEEELEEYRRQGIPIYDRR